MFLHTNGNVEFNVVKTFLSQESLNLWQRQLLERQEDADFQDEVAGVLRSVQLAESCTTTLLAALVSLASLLYCALASDCCHACCCPAINELEQVR